MRVEKSRTTGPSPNVLADALGLEHQLARRLGALRPAAARCRDLVAARGALLAHRHQRVDAAFVARPPRLDALAQPHFFLGQLLVELLLLDRFVGEPLFLLLQKVA